jgi:hypothetical protein
MIIRVFKIRIFFKLTTFVKYQKDEGDIIRILFNFGLMAITNKQFLASLLDLVGTWTVNVHRHCVRRSTSISNTSAYIYIYMLFVEYDL